MLSVFLYAIHKNCSAKKRAELDEYFRELPSFFRRRTPPRMQAYMLLSLSLLPVPSR
jgi:hypothetical protein